MQIVRLTKTDNSLQIEYTNVFFYRTVHLYKKESLSYIGGNNRCEDIRDLSVQLYLVHRLI